MTHLLSSALEKHSPDWLRLGLERSYSRTVNGKVYVVVVDRTGPIAVYRCPGGKRGSVVRIDKWPAAVTEPLGDDPPAAPVQEDAAAVRSPHR